MNISAVIARMSATVAARRRPVMRYGSAVGNDQVDDARSARQSEAARRVAGDGIDVGDAVEHLDEHLPEAGEDDDDERGLQLVPVHEDGERDERDRRDRAQELDGRVRRAAQERHEADDRAEDDRQHGRDQQADRPRRHRAADVAPELQVAEHARTAARACRSRSGSRPGSRSRAWAAAATSARNPTMPASRARPCAACAATGRAPAGRAATVTGASTVTMGVDPIGAGRASDGQARGAGCLGSRHPVPSLVRYCCWISRSKSGSASM